MKTTKTSKCASKTLIASTRDALPEAIEIAGAFARFEARQAQEAALEPFREAYWAAVYAAKAAGTDEAWALVEVAEVAYRAMPGAPQW